LRSSGGDACLRISDVTEDEREEWVQKLAASAMISVFMGTSIVCALRRRGLVEVGGPFCGDDVR
jgi:hypothetical protein